MFRGPEEPGRQNKVVRTGDVTIDLGGQAVLRGGKEVRLSPTEYGLISALAANAGLVMNHRTLLRSVWGRGYGDERHYLRTYVQRLRAKLEADPKHPEVVVTVGWRGYRLGRPAVLLRPDVDWSARLFDFNRIRDLNEEEVSRSAEIPQAATL